MDKYLVRYNLKRRLWHRYLLHLYLQPFCRKRSRLPDEVLDQNVYLFAQHRGGSTWLSEILNTIPRSTVLIEPLWRGRPLTDGSMPPFSVGRCDEIRLLNFYYQQPIPQDAEWPEAVDFFKRLFKVEISKLGLYNKIDIRKISGFDTFIFKFCFGNQLLAWLTQNLDIKPILLVRHPCAVVHSQMSMLHWDRIFDHPAFIIPDFRYNELYHQYKHILDRVQTVEENLAAQWCLNMVTTLENPLNNKKWLTVAYENLYLNYQEEVQRIFTWLGRPIPEGVTQLHHRPSRYAKESSYQYIKSGNQLNHWKEKLTTEQTDRILSIVEAFGLKVYSEDPLPNLKLVYNQ